MVSASDDKLRIVWPMNWCDRNVSADDADILATLYALCETYQVDDLVEKHHALPDFAGEHPQACSIYATHRLMAKARVRGPFCLWRRRACRTRHR